MSDTKQIYIDKLQAQMKEWAAQADVLAAKADQAKADAKLEALARIEELKAAGSTMQAKLAEIQAAGEDSWDELKAGADKAWDTLKIAFTAKV
ncbi:MAG: coiled coil domain-containing protein [Candidatus Sericytochromatia bacterium]|nr:coiled coil domain-containing protein [Candidatus Sericytochromatia bacterium]